MLHLQTDDFAHMLPAERLEHDDFVNAVQKLRPYAALQDFEYLALGPCHHFFLIQISEGFELLADHIRTEVRCHDDDGVAEVRGAPFVIRESAVIKHLQQDVEYIGMGFFDFVEQHHTVRTATHGFGELSAFIVSHIARRRSDQAADGMLLLVFAHVDPDHGLVGVEEEFSQRLGELCLTHTRSAKEYKGTDGFLRILQTGPAAAHGV